VKRPSRVQTPAPDALDAIDRSIVASVGVTLRPMSAEEFARWLPTMREGYARDISVDGGASEDAAQRKAAADIEELFPGDRPSAEQFVFVLEAEGQEIGELWLAEREGLLGRHLWVYDVHVKDAYRGRGYGREAMLLAEAEARRRGLVRVMLHAFGGNEVARNLYRSLGYRENSVLMSKDL
jgi:GNAT superfamily N-acetyltransferase